MIMGVFIIYFLHWEGLYDTSFLGIVKAGASVGNQGLGRNTGCIYLSRTFGFPSMYLLCTLEVGTPEDVVQYS